MKSHGLTVELLGILLVLRHLEATGTNGGAVKCVDIVWNAKVKTGCWGCTDAETRKPGEQTGLDTPVVLALNDVY